MIMIDSYLLNFTVINSLMLFIVLNLVWCFSFRLVSKGHVPYVNVHELFPEEMRFFGKDALIFRVEVS